MLPDLPPALEAWAVQARPYAFRDEAILGTRMNLVLVARSFAEARAAALTARAEIDRLAAILDTRRPDSEIAALNRSEVFAASPDLYAVVEAAERWRAASGGAFSGRLGRVVAAWNRPTAPSPHEASDLAGAAAAASVEMEPDDRRIVRPPAVAFVLDGLAKGWIVDRAFEAAIRQPGVAGALVDIGGDARSGGASPAGGWVAELPDPLRPFDNAPAIARADLAGRAIAASGRGPRDRLIEGVRFSPTLSPFDGWPVGHAVGAAVIAPAAMDADALATALLVLPPADAAVLADRLDTPVRITLADGRLQPTRLGAAFGDAPPRIVRTAAATGAKWPSGWQALATFTAPRRQLIRDPDFRSPYMAMWITDLQNRPVRTLIVIGKNPEWQRDNFIWYQLNRAAFVRLGATRAMSTSGAGVYNVFWNGVDDAGRPVPAGDYILHVETSRERGKHTYRSLTLDFSTGRRFTSVLPPTEEGGGLKVSFDHY